MGKSIYRSAEAKQRIQQLHRQKRQALDFPFEEVDVQTAFGRTRVVKTGNPQGKPIVLFHGVHAGAPLTLESVSPLRERYLLIAIETIGQATMSDETLMNLKDSSFALWADEVLQELGVEQAPCIGISYGAFLLQKLITHKPQRVERCIFVVPGGLANGPFWPSFTKLSIPLIRWHITGKDDDLRTFVSAFADPEDSYMFDYQKAILSGLHMDYRRPPILKESDVQDFHQPVYMILADDDVFFPAEATLQQANRVFKNLRDTYLLSGCKHIPFGRHLSEISEKITVWLEE